MLQQKPEHPRLLRASKQLKVSLTTIGGYQPVGLKLPLLGKDTNRSKSIVASKSSGDSPQDRRIIGTRGQSKERSVHELTPRSENTRFGQLSRRVGLLESSRIHKSSTTSAKKNTNLRQGEQQTRERCSPLQVVSARLSVPVAGRLYLFDHGQERPRKQAATNLSALQQRQKQRCEAGQSPVAAAIPDIEPRSALCFGPLTPCSGRLMALLLGTVERQQSELLSRVTAGLKMGCYVWCWTRHSSQTLERIPPLADSTSFGEPLTTTTVGLAVGTINVDPASQWKELLLLHIHFKEPGNLEEMIKDLKNLIIKPLDGYQLNQLSLTLRQEGWFDGAFEGDTVQKMLQRFTIRGFQVITQEHDRIELALTLHHQQQEDRQSPSQVSSSDEEAPIAITTTCIFDKDTLSHRYKDRAEEPVGLLNSRIFFGNIHSR